MKEKIKKTFRYLMIFLMKLKNWLLENHTLLGSLSSFVTIFSLIIIMLGFFQLLDYFKRADLYFEFVNPSSVSFYIHNYSEKLADRPDYGFGLFDVDSEEITVLPIPWKTTDFIRPGGYRGPTSLINQYGAKEHRYFGFAYVSCANCETQRRYWLFIDNRENKKTGWYAETKDGENLLSNPNLLNQNLDFYLNKVDISRRRQIIKR